MEINRRQFIAASAGACACALAGGCTAVNPAPLFEAPDGELAVPPDLAKPGSQIKVKLARDTVLVWRTGDGVLMAATITCTHMGSEVSWNAQSSTLDCPSHGSRFKADGSILTGPAKRPLRALKITEDSGRLKVI